MMTAEENDLLCRVEGDAPMGQIMRRHWMPACLIEEVAEPDGEPLKVRLLGEDLVVFRDSDGRLGVIDEYCPHRRASLAYRPQRGMRAALPLSRLEDGRGRQRRRDGVRAAGKRLRREGEGQGLSGARMGRLRLDLYGPGRDDAGIRAAGFRADAEMRRSRSSRFTSAATGRRSWKAQINSAHSLEPAFLRHEAGQGRCAPRRSTPIGCGRRPTRRRACRSSARATASIMPRSAGRSPMRRRTTTCASRSIIAPFTALIPPNNEYNVATVHVPDRRHEYGVPFHRLERDDGGIEQEAWRKFNVRAARHRSRRRLPQPAHAREQLPAGSQGDEARRFHRHQGHSQPGYRDVGDDGADRRPHAGSGSAPATSRSSSSAS